jgi:uncharacterized protein
LNDVTLRRVEVPTADGVVLRANLYVREGGGPTPTLLLRTPYGATDAQRWLYAHPLWYARNGYTVVVQDVRGRWDSDGEFDPFRCERVDGAATIEWIARQPWCDGRVGMYGMSYPGAVQLLAASARPEGLAAIAPGMSSVDFGGWAYVGGTLNLAFVLWWAASLGVDTARRAGDLTAVETLSGLVDAPEALYGRFDAVAADELLPPEAARYVPYLREWLEHPDDDAYWQQIAPQNALESVDVPALHVGGWWDVFLAGTVHTYRRLRDRDRAPQHLVLGPWIHAPWGAVVGDRDFGASAGGGVDDVQLMWFDHWLRERPLELAPVRAFVVNADIWVEEDDWPPPRAREQRLFLSSGGRANSRDGDGRLVAAPPDASLPDVFVHDPRAPLRSAGGHSCCFEAFAPVGPRDQRRSEVWNDLLVYESAPVGETVRVAGEVRAELHVSFSGISADFVCRLVDVHPCGAAYNLADSVVRIDRVSPRAYAGTTIDSDGDGFRISLPLGHTYVELREGHCLRLEVGGSSYPAYARNWNGAPPRLAPTDFAGAMSIQEVAHDRAHPSALVLPVVEGRLQ